MVSFFSKTNAAEVDPSALRFSKKMGQNSGKDKKQKKASLEVSRLPFAPENSSSPDAQWGWPIYLQNWVVLGVNVGKYTHPMEHLGSGNERIVIIIQSRGKLVC